MKPSLKPVRKAIAKSRVKAIQDAVLFELSYPSGEKYVGTYGQITAYQLKHRARHLNENLGIK